VNAKGASRSSDILRQLSFLLMLVAVAASMPSAVFAQSTSRPSAYSELEHLPIRTRGAATAPSTQQSALTGAPTRPKSLIDLPRLALAMGVVLLLIFLVRAVGQKFFPNITMSRATSAVRVLSRNSIAHKQQVLLVQVGRRILVLGDNGSQMQPLSEITDPDEVAQLIGQATGAKEQFNKEFDKAQDAFDQTPEPAPPTELAMSEDAEDAQGADDEALPEPMNAAHGEINGLMEKVRGLARQLGR
jgi:flagellar biogenesis protein FliO